MLILNLAVDIAASDTYGEHSLPSTMNFAIVVFVIFAFAFLIFFVLPSAVASNTFYPSDSGAYANVTRHTKSCPLNACEVLVYITKTYSVEAAAGLDHLKKHQQQQQHQKRSRPASNSDANGDGASSGHPHQYERFGMLDERDDYEARIRAVERRLRSVEQPGETANVEWRLNVE